MKKLFAFSFSVFFFSLTQAQVITIAEARSLPEGTDVTVRGLVLNGSELGDVRYLQDATGNIAAFNSTMLDAILRGDSIEVSGPLFSYNSLLEISSTTSVTVLNSGNPLPSPILITCAGGWIEGNEGKLVKVDDATFTETGTFSSSGSGTNYDVNDGTATAEVRVITATNIDGTPIPEDAVSITGIMSQYAPSGSGGYQLLPRDLTDLAPPGNPPVISSILTQTNITTSSFTVNFSTLYEGNTIVYYGTTSALGSTASDATLTTSHAIDLSGLTAGTIYYIKAVSVSASNDTSYSSIVTMASQSNSSGVIHYWFNSPVNNSVSDGTNAEYITNMDDSIISYIDRAQYSLDIAIYNIDNTNNIITAINDAYARGVVVRVICDDGVNSDYDLINVGAGNKKKSPTGTTSTGDFYGIMHNKFIVVDVLSTDPNDAWVLGGSANMTDQQVQVDHQNMVVIQDQSLAKAYRIEFDEMFAGNFGSEKQNNTPHEFIIGGKRVELYFSPSDDVETQIIRQINNADHDLYFAIFTLTRFGISYTIEDAVEDRGVFAAGMYDETDPSDSTAITVLEDALGERFRKHIGSVQLHHKYLIVDPHCNQADPIVLTGSHNWSSSANSRNDENTLIIHDSVAANIYYQEWVARYAEDGGTEYISDEACDYVGVQPE
ncbi:MAG: phospholipase D-like domain-containing protein, partial [Chitinophagales bacterium]